MLDTYELLLSDENDGIKFVSLVDMPAVEVGWQCYGKEKKPVQFSVTEERVITGVVMIPDKLIYRRDGWYEYQVYYSRETIRNMCELMLKNDSYKYVDLNHDNETVGDKATLLEVFLKDTAKGINPTAFEDLPDGTMFCSYHINDEELWSKCKDGTFTGFSLEGLFSTKPAQYKKTSKNNMLKSLKEKLAKILLEFGEIETDNGTLTYEGEEITVGTEVFIGEGAAPDGEYKADGKVYTVAGGIVTAITDEATEETTEEETEETETEEVEMEEETTEEETVDYQAEIDALKETIATLTAEIETIKEAIKNIDVVEPIEEQFSKQEQNKWADIIKGIRK